MAAKKGKTDTHLSVEILRDLADKMMELETKNLKKWSKRPAIKRGEDLQGLIEAKFPGIGEEALRIAMWVDLYIYTCATLTDNDYYFTLMNTDEAITALMKYEKKNPSQFEGILEWVGDFGCLLTEGSDSDIGAWFHDWFFEPLFEVEALADKEYLFLDNPSKAQLGKLAKSVSVRDRVQAALQSEDAELLKTLAQDSATAVRMAAAMNPSTPEMVLEILSRDPVVVVKEAALRNESTSIESIESSGSEAGSLNIASSKKATPESLAKLANDKDEEIRTEVAKNKNTPVEVLLKLAKDKSSDVREAVVDNPNTPIEALMKLAKDDDEFVRGYLASRQDLSQEIMKILAKDKDSWVKERLAENSTVSKEVLEILSKDSDSSVREKAIKNENLDDDSIENFENPDSVKLALAGNPSTPEDILEEFSENSEPIYFQGNSTSLMRAVASNPSIPDSVIDKLVKSKNKEVIKELAKNPHLPTKQLDELVQTSLKRIQSGKSNFADRDLEIALSENPSAPSSYLVALLKHSDTWVVSNVAANPNLPPEKLAKLAKSEHNNIRKGVASNPRASWVLLQSLLKDDECKWQLAQNPAMRGEDLAELALQKTAGPNLLSDIAMNPSLSKEQIEKLAKHKDESVRLGVARNPNTPKTITLEILNELIKLKDESNTGDVYVTRCEFTPAEMIDEILERYLPLKSTYRANILCCIASNPNTRPETLNKLAGDRFSEVRAAVAGNPNTPVEVLRRLSH